VSARVIRVSTRTPDAVDDVNTRTPDTVDGGDAA